MALNGIDVSSWQSALNVGAINADFVIIKATEGNYYVNPHCDVHYQQAKSAGKKLGVYHFADHGDAVQEADYFVDNITGYIGEAILVLDWEGIFTADTGWAKTFLDHVYSKTGVKPLIYMSSNVVQQDWSDVINAGYGLWVAQYADSNIHYNYSIVGSDANVNWGSTSNAMWQWTSTGRLDGYGANLDCNVFYGDQAAWDAYAAKIEQPTPQPEPAPQPEPTPAPDPTPITPSPEPTPTPVVTPATQPSLGDFLKALWALIKKLFRR